MKTLAKFQAMLKMWRMLSALVLLLAAACAPLAAPAGNPDKPAKITADAGEKVDAIQAASSSPLTGYALLIGNKASSGAVRIIRINLSTGQPDPGENPIEIGQRANYVFSPDRSRLAVTSDALDCKGTCLRVFRLADLQATTPIDLPKMAGPDEWISQLVFDPQGKQLAMSYYQAGILAIADFSRQPAGELRQADLDFQARLAAFSADGQQLMLVGVPIPKGTASSAEINPQLEALLVDVKTLEVTWRHDLAGIKDGYYGSEDYANPEENFFYESGMAVDADNLKIYIAHADADQLTQVDFQRRTVETVEIGKQQSSLEKLIETVLAIGVAPVEAKAANNYSRFAMLSEDKQTLYVGGLQNLMEKSADNQWNRHATYLPLETWDVKSGARLLSVDAKAVAIHQSPDGKILLKGYDPNLPIYQPYTEIFDPASGHITALLENTSAYFTLSTSGERLLVSSYSDENGKTYLSVLNANSHQVELSVVRDWDYAFWPEDR